jgi:hypothetical protein
LVADDPYVSQVTDYTFTIYPSYIYPEFSTLKLVFPTNPRFNTSDMEVVALKGFDHLTDPIKRTFVIRLQNATNLIWANTSDCLQVKIKNIKNWPAAGGVPNMTVSVLNADDYYLDRVVNGNRILLNLSIVSFTPKPVTIQTFSVVAADY